MGVIHAPLSCVNTRTRASNAAKELNRSRNSRVGACVPRGLTHRDSASVMVRIGSRVAAAGAPICRGVEPAGVGTSTSRSSSLSRAVWPSSTAARSSSVSELGWLREALQLLADRDEGGEDDLDAQAPTQMPMSADARPLRTNARRSPVRKDHLWRDATPGDAVLTGIPGSCPRGQLVPRGGTVREIRWSSVSRWTQLLRL